MNNSSIKPEIKTMQIYGSRLMILLHDPYSHHTRGYICRDPTALLRKILKVMILSIAT